MRQSPVATRAASYSDTMSIMARVDSIERYVAADSQRLRVFASVPDDPRLVQVKDSTDWPEATEASINVVMDASGRPLLHREMPTSESGDWLKVISHYFDPEGRTILYDLEISGFGSECTSILRETKRVFLSPTGNTIAELRSFADEDGKAIKPDGCFLRSDNAASPKRAASELRFPK